MFNSSVNSIVNYLKANKKRKVSIKCKNRWNSKHIKSIYYKLIKSNILVFSLVNDCGYSRNGVRGKKKNINFK